MFYLCTLYCCLYVLFLLLFSFVLFMWQGISLPFLFGLSLVYCLPFSGYGISCGLRRKQPPPHINYIASAGVITWERSHYIAHLISWLVHRSNAHLSHSSFGHLISWYGREIAGFRPSGIFSHTVGNLEIEPRGALSVSSYFFFLPLSLGEYCQSFGDFYLLSSVLDVVHPFCRSFDSLFLSYPFVPSCR